MDDPQIELPMPFPELSGDFPLLPARIVNEYQYCPHLAYLEWLQGEWTASAYISRTSFLSAANSLRPH